MVVSAGVTYTARVPILCSRSLRLRVPLLALGLGVTLAACGGAKDVEFFDTSPSPTPTVDEEPSTPAPGLPNVVPTGAPEDDASAPPVDAPCSTSKECQDGFLCEVASCRGQGACVPASDFDGAPHCSCDGATYAAGASPGKAAVRHAGACKDGEATACTSRSVCTGGAECNMPVKEFLACNGSPPGTCWRWPSTCPSAPASVRSCGTTPACTTVCASASAGRPYYAGAGCP